MRKSLSYILTALLVGLFAAVIGCGESSSFYKSTTTDPSASQTAVDPTTSTTSGTASAGDPISRDELGDLLDDMIVAFDDLKTFNGFLEVDMEMELDPDELTPEDSYMMGGLGSGVTISAMVRADLESEAIDMDMSISMMGLNINMAIRVLGEEAWMKVGRQWYDFTPALEEEDADAAYPEELDEEAMTAILTDLDIDPVDWLVEEATVSEETLEGDKVQHLSCTPDIEAMVTDLMLLMEDGRLLELLDPSGEMAQDLELDELTGTSDSEMQEILDELESMVDEASLELWVGKDDRLLRRVEVHTMLVPPPGEDSEGVESIEFTITLSMDDINEPVEIEAPEEYLPYEDLEDGMMGSFFGGMGDGFSDW